MHQNYHFIKQLAPRLHEELAGKVFVEAFSQQKDELIIVFAAQSNDVAEQIPAARSYDAARGADAVNDVARGAETDAPLINVPARSADIDAAAALTNVSARSADGEANLALTNVSSRSAELNAPPLEKPFFIKATLTNTFSCLSFPERFDRARKNSVNLFQDFAGDEVAFVKVCRNERAIQVHFESGRDLIFKLFGNRSNFIAFNEAGEVTQLFNNKLTTDRTLTVAGLNRDIDQSWEAFVANQGRFEPLFPTFGKVANQYVKAKLDGTEDLAERWAVLQAVLKEFESSTFYITKIETIPALTLFETGEVMQVLHDPMEALNAFYLAYIRLSGLDKEKADIVRLLKKRIQQTDNYLENTFQKLVDLENATKNDELANIIMANLHAIPERSEKAELYDFYRDQPIVIKLKKDLSAQKNAEGYYRKAKNEKIEIDRLNDSLTARETDRERLKAHLQHIESTTSLRDMRAYIKTHKLEQGNAGPAIDDLFKRVDFMGYTILIGRNAKNSDLLTKQAHKEDLWLHAKDVTGSHVVVKHQPGRKFPAPVIERAAELAAFYSKRKNDSLCPVIVTPKKFIRKPKGLPDGLVLIDKEDIVMVVAKGE